MKLTHAHAIPQNTHITRDLFQQLVSNAVCISGLWLTLPWLKWPQLPYVAQELTHQSLCLLPERSFYPTVQGTQGNPTSLLNSPVSSTLLSITSSKGAYTSESSTEGYIWFLQNEHTQLHPHIWMLTRVTANPCAHTHTYIRTHTQSFQWTLLCKSRSSGSNGFDFLLGILRVMRRLLSMYVLVVWHQAYYLHRGQLEDNCRTEQWPESWHACIHTAFWSSPWEGELFWTSMKYFTCSKTRKTSLLPKMTVSSIWYKIYVYYLHHQYLHHHLQYHQTGFHHHLQDQTCLFRWF